MAANVRPERGTKHFVPGALVWILSGYFRESMDRVRILGPGWRAVMEKPHKLTNFRAELVHDGELADKLRGFLPEGRWFDREHCVDKAELLNGSFPPVADLPAEVAKWAQLVPLLAKDPLARQAARALVTEEMPFEVYVLADYLDKLGLPLTVAEIVRTLR